MKKQPQYTTIKKVKTKAGHLTILKNKEGLFLWAVTAPNGTVTCAGNPVRVLLNVEKNARSVVKTLSAVFK